MGTRRGIVFPSIASHNATSWTGVGEERRQRNAMKIWWTLTQRGGNIGNGSYEVYRNISYCRLRMNEVTVSRHVAWWYHPYRQRTCQNKKPTLLRTCVKVALKGPVRKKTTSKDLSRLLHRHVARYRPYRWREKKRPVIVKGLYCKKRSPAIILKLYIYLIRIFKSFTCLFGRYTFNTDKLLCNGNGTVCREHAFYFCVNLSEDLFIEIPSISKPYRARTHIGVLVDKVCTPRKC